MMLLEAQFLFTRLLGQLYTKATELGFLVQGGELYRTPEQAKLNAAAGTGIANSLHCERLAQDVLLWKASEHNDGTYRQVPGADVAYRTLGDYWKTLDPRCAWGGDFEVARGHDYGHFSLSWGGVR